MSSKRVGIIIYSRPTNVEIKDAFHSTKIPV